jgi:hypothetical protein
MISTPLTYFAKTDRLIIRPYQIADVPDFLDMVQSSMDQMHAFLPWVTPDFDERNERLLKLLTGFLNKKDYPITFMDFGAGNAHISRTFKRALGDKVKIYCLEPNPVCKDFYNKYGLIHLLKLNDLSEKIDLIYKN